MGKVLIWFVIIISIVVLYCLMKVKAESDELYLDKVFYDENSISYAFMHLKYCSVKKCCIFLVH